MRLDDDGAEQIGTCSLLVTAFRVDVLTTRQFEKGLKLGQLNVAELPCRHGL